MRILTWNILHGGGRERSPRILMEILDLRPDVVVVTEARRRFAAQICGAFADAGLEHSLGPVAPDGINAVMLLAREPLAQAPSRDVPACLRHRWLETTVVPRNVRLAAVHLPEAGRTREHAEAWRYLLLMARAMGGDRTILAGDLNTWRDGPPERRRTGATATNLGRLAALGYTDAWVAAGDTSDAATWRGHFGEAFRLDYVLVSRALAGGVERAWVVAPERDGKLSDHAAVVVDISTEPQNQGLKA